LIWTHSKDGAWDRQSLVSAMRRLRLKLGMRRGITLYGYRSRYATGALEKGIDAISVSELLGHRSLEMVKRHYAHLGKDHLKKAAEIAAREKDTA